MIFLENVKGFVNHDRGNTFNIVKQTLEDLGYKVYAKVLNAKDFGVPQNRERIYIVAFLGYTLKKFFFFPEETDSSKQIKDILEDGEVSVKYYLSAVYLASLKRHKERHTLKGNGLGYEIRDPVSLAGAIVCGGMWREKPCG